MDHASESRTNAAEDGQRGCDSNRMPCHLAGGCQEVCREVWHGHVVPGVEYVAAGLKVVDSIAIASRGLVVVDWQGPADTDNVAGIQQSHAVVSFFALAI
jgi:hypothetical protein